MLNHSAIGNRKLKIRQTARGRFELPTNPESFRGCSTCLESELQDEDSFSLLGVALYLALPSVSSTRAEPQLEIRRFALSCAYDHGDVEQVERQIGRRTN